MTSRVHPVLCRAPNPVSQAPRSFDYTPLSPDPKSSALSNAVALNQEPALPVRKISPQSSRYFDCTQSPNHHRPLICNRSTKSTHPLRYKRSQKSDPWAFDVAYARKSGGRNTCNDSPDSSENIKTGWRKAACVDSLKHKPDGRFAPKEAEEFNSFLSFSRFFYFLF